MFALLHSFQPSPILFSVGPFAVHWYGLFGALGLYLAWVVIARLAKQYNIKADVFNLFFGVIVFALIGARLYHVVNELTFYLANPSLILAVWRGGLALHGGIIGGLLYGWWWVRKHNLSFLLMADIFAVGGIFLQALGRWGNYFNQELFGRPTDLPWGIPIASINRPSGFAEFEFFHPTFLYESVLNLALFALLFGLHKARLAGRIKLPNGALFAVYLLFYSLVRFFLEFLRIDATPVLFGLRLPQIVSILVIFIISIIFIKQYIYHGSDILSVGKKNYSR